MDENTCDKIRSRIDIMLASQLTTPFEEAQDKVNKKHNAATVTINISKYYFEIIGSILEDSLDQPAMFDNADSLATDFFSEIDKAIYAYVKNRNKDIVMFGLTVKSGVVDAYVADKHEPRFSWGIEAAKELNTRDIKTTFAPAGLSITPRDTNPDDDKLAIWVKRDSYGNFVAGLRERNGVFAGGKKIDMQNAGDIKFVSLVMPMLDKFVQEQHEKEHVSPIMD